jgi:hypothetical protein
VVSGSWLLKWCIKGRPAVLWVKTRACRDGGSVKMHCDEGSGC